MGLGQSVLTSVVAPEGCLEAPRAWTQATSKGDNDEEGDGDDDDGSGDDDDDDETKQRTSTQPAPPDARWTCRTSSARGPPQRVATSTDMILIPSSTGGEETV
eukprot:COSAG05_NODE_2194_length_3418_cov_6.232901_6_plen_103_part_00